MPRQDFLETREDMKWLEEVHIPGASTYACAIVYGNSDCPDKVELYASNNVGCRPAVYVNKSPMNKLFLDKIGDSPDTAKQPVTTPVQEPDNAKSLSDHPEPLHSTEGE